MKHALDIYTLELLMIGLVLHTLFSNSQMYLNTHIVHILSSILPQLAELLLRHHHGMHENMLHKTLPVSSEQLMDGNTR